MNSVGLFRLVDGSSRGSEVNISIACHRISLSPAIKFGFLAHSNQSDAWIRPFDLGQLRWQGVSLACHPCTVVAAGDRCIGTEYNVTKGVHALERQNSLCALLTP